MKRNQSAPISTRRNEIGKTRKRATMAEQSPPAGQIKPSLKPPSSSFRLRSKSLNSVRLRRVFDLFDKNGDEYITVAELADALARLGLTTDPSELESTVSGFIQPGAIGLDFNDFQVLVVNLSLCVVQVMYWLNCQLACLLFLYDMLNHTFDLDCDTYRIDNGKIYFHVWYQGVPVGTSMYCLSNWKLLPFFFCAFVCFLFGVEWICYKQKEVSR